MGRYVRTQAMRRRDKWCQKERDDQCREWERLAHGEWRLLRTEPEPDRDLELAAENPKAAEAA